MADASGSVWFVLKVCVFVLCLSFFVCLFVFFVCLVFVCVLFCVCVFFFLLPLQIVSASIFVGT